MKSTITDATAIGYWPKRSGPIRRGERPRKLKFGDPASIAIRDAARDKANFVELVARLAVLRAKWEPYTLNRQHYPPLGSMTLEQAKAEMAVWNEVGYRDSGECE